MLGHFKNLPEFLYRLASKLDLYLGIAAGVIFVAIAYFTSLDEQTAATITIGIGGLTVLVSAFSVFHEEREHRRQQEAFLRLTAKIASFSMNDPDPGPDKSSISVGVVWEIWVSRDVATDKFGLVLTLVYDRPLWQFWKFWKKKLVPYRGIPDVSTGSTQLREWIRATEDMPRRGEGVFEFVGDREMTGDPHWLLELVLRTGEPEARFSVPLAIDWNQDSRMNNPPL